MNPITETPEQVVKELAHSHARHIIEIAIGETVVPPLLVIYGQEPGNILVQDMEFTDKNRPPEVLHRAGENVARQGFTPIAISLAVETWMQEIDLKDLQQDKVSVKDNEAKVERLMVATLDWQKHDACEIYDIERDEQGRFTAFPRVPIDPGHFKVKLLHHFYQGFAISLLARAKSSATLQ